MENREIKFRAYHAVNKVMMDNKSLSVLAKNIKDCNVWKYMQFTGLEDKNGKEIYEGDILEYKNEFGRHNLHKVFRSVGGLVINSHKDDFYKKELTPFYEACADNQTSQYIKQCEVIGNIYENPELL